jgi:DNA-binding transcriptional LysR family regulator
MREAHTVDMDLLRTLRAITETGSTLAAAAELNVSQSAVSRRLTQLEELLGLPLFTRDKGRLIPTPENRALMPQIRTMLDHQHRLTTRAEELRTGNASSVTLRVAVPASMTLAILPEILAEFLARNDRVQVEVHTGAYDTIERMLTDERAELGFLRAPAQRPGSR